MMFITKSHVSHLSQIAIVSSADILC